MRRIVICLMFCLLWALAVSAQTNPCIDPPPAGVVLDPTKLVVTLPEHTAVTTDGAPLVTEYQAAYFTQTDGIGGTPVQGPSTMPKTVFSLVAGTTDCYQTTLPLPVPVIGQTTALVGAVKALNTSYNLESAWSGASNPFGRAPTVLQTPGRPVVTR